MSPGATFAHDQGPPRDREVIRISTCNDALGIAESLRRAFCAASQDDSTHDFEKLINELN